MLDTNFDMIEYRDSIIQQIFNEIIQEQDKCPLTGYNSYYRNKPYRRRDEQINLFEVFLPEKGASYIIKKFIKKGLIGKFLQKALINYAKQFIKILPSLPTKILLSTTPFPKDIIGLILEFVIDDIYDIPYHIRKYGEWNMEKVNIDYSNRNLIDIKSLKSSSYFLTYENGHSEFIEHNKWPERRNNLRRCHHDYNMFLTVFIALDPFMNKSCLKNFKHLKMVDCGNIAISCCEGCSSLIDFEINPFYESVSYRSMKDMFKGCTNVESGNFCKWSQKINNMDSSFYGTKSLQFDLKHWNIEKHIKNCTLDYTFIDSALKPIRSQFEKIKSLEDKMKYVKAFHWKNTGVLVDKGLLVNVPSLRLQYNTIKDPLTVIPIGPLVQTSEWINKISSLCHKIQINNYPIYNNSIKDGKLIKLPYSYKHIDDFICIGCYENSLNDNKNNCKKCSYINMDYSQSYDIKKKMVYVNIKDLQICRLCSVSGYEKCSIHFEHKHLPDWKLLTIYGPRYERIKVHCKQELANIMINPIYHNMINVETCNNGHCKISNQYSYHSKYPSLLEHIYIMEDVIKVKYENNSLKLFSTLSSDKIWCNFPYTMVGYNNTIDYEGTKSIFKCKGEEKLILGKLLEHKQQEFENIQKAKDDINHLKYRENKIVSELEQIRKKIAFQKQNIKKRTISHSSVIQEIQEFQKKKNRKLSSNHNTIHSPSFPPSSTSSFSQSSTSSFSQSIRVHQILLDKFR